MTTTVNVPLLRKAVEFAEAEFAKPPELCEWFQGAYILPSEADADDYLWHGLPCTADFARYEREQFGKAQECGTCFCVAGWVAHETTGNMDGFKAAEIAADALGLSVGDAADLFAGSNDIEDVRRIAERLAGERL